MRRSIRVSDIKLPRVDLGEISDEEKLSSEERKKREERAEERKEKEKRGGYNWEGNGSEI